MPLIVLPPKSTFFQTCFSPAHHTSAWTAPRWQLRSKLEVLLALLPRTSRCIYQHVPWALSPKFMQSDPFSRLDPRYLPPGASPWLLTGTLAGSPAGPARSVLATVARGRTFNLKSAPARPPRGLPHSFGINLTALPTGLRTPLGEALPVFFPRFFISVFISKKQNKTQPKTGKIPLYIQNTSSVHQKSLVFFHFDIYLFIEFLTVLICKSITFPIMISSLPVPLERLLLSLYGHQYFLLALLCRENIKITSQYFFFFFFKFLTIVLASQDKF